MKKIFWLAVIICGLAFSAGADSLKGGRIACLTEDEFEQAITAAARKDERAWAYLLQNGCLIPKAGIKISILDTTWTGTAKVRAYFGEDAWILWTTVENIVRDKK